jgi:hypothetical protein
MKLPVYDALLEDKTDGVTAIAIVDNPAMQVEWQLFNKKEQDDDFGSTRKDFNLNDEKMVITYPLIIAEKLIYRDIPFPHYIKFSKKTIKEMALRFHKNGVNNFNEMHTDKEIVDKMFIFESWLKGEVDKSNDMGYKDISEGSWFISIQVTDKDYWNNIIKKGEFKGLSMETYYSINDEYLKLEHFIRTLVDSNLDEEVLYKTLVNFLDRNKNN